jgi:DNA-binding FrmR family transcriptional regulator
MTAGYTGEDDRLARNAREIVYGRVKSIENAIAKYKELQYDEVRESIEAIDAQINEAIQVMKMDKIEMCRVEKVTTRPDGEQIKTSYVDGIQAVKLIAEAAKLGVKIKELRDAKLSLLATTPEEESTLDITTNTASDLDNIDDEGMSTLDMVNQKQFSDDNTER